MADLRITNLPAMAAGTAQNSDVLPVSDISASTTKKITIADLIKDGIDALPDGSINGDKVNFTLANGSVGTAQLVDGSVTGVKLANGSAAGTGAALPAAGDYVGQLFFKTTAPRELYSWNGASWDATSGLIAVAGDTTGLVNTYVSTSGGTATVSADIDSTTGPGEFLAGPSGGPGAIDHRRIASQDLPTAGAQKGAVAVNGNGLAMSGDTLSLNKGAATSSSGQLVTYDDQGLVVSGAAIQSSDLPLGSDSQVGAVMPGSGLSVGVDGALNHANSVVSGTAPKITFDTEGHVTAGQALLPSDIPDLPASKITSGQFSTPYIADESITLPKLADYSIAYIQEAQPSTVDPGHIGVLWYQESTAQLRMWNGNSFRPIGFGRLSQENLRWGGTVDASTGLIAGVTEAGTTGGLKIGDAVPPASDQLGGLYLVVSVAGSSIGETPGITYDAGDWCLCVNATEGWIRIDTLNGGGGGGASRLGDLLDVTLTAEAAGEFIQLQANGQWQNIELEPGTIGALKPGDNVSELVNDAGYLVPGDDVSELNNDAGYITSGDIPAGANLWTENTGKVYPTNLSNHVQVGGTAADPNIQLNASGAASFDGPVGIGTNEPKAELHIDSGLFSAGSTASDKTLLLSSGQGSGGINVLGASLAFNRVSSSTYDEPRAAIAVKEYTSNFEQCGLTFWTHPSSTASDAMEEAMCIRHDGNVGIATELPEEKLHVANDGDVSLLLQSGGLNQDRFKLSKSSSGNKDCTLRSSTGTSPSPLIFAVNATGEAARFDTSGCLLVNTDTPISSFEMLQINSTGPANVAGLYRQVNDAAGPRLYLTKTRGSITSIVSNTDTLGEIRFAGSDGVDVSSYGAVIAAFVDGTPGADNMPGRLGFSTTADGASTPTERMRIDKDGRIGLNGTVNNARFYFGGDTAYSSDVGAIGYQNAATISSNTTGTYQAFNTYNAVSATTDLSNCVGYGANFESIKPGGKLADLIGFRAGSSLTAATNNYGFYSDIAPGTGRWNFYANGAASNYFAGDVLIGSATAVQPSSTTTSGFTFKSLGAVANMSRADNPVLILQRTGSDGEIQQFYRQNTQVGNISVTDTATAFNTSSDYRLKENITSIVDAADRVKALKPCRFNFKADADKTVDGFLAHEAQEVVPESVTGTKDATEAIGTLFDWDGKVREENVTEPAELTYSEEVIDDPGQQGKEAVYSEPVLIQEYQPAVYGEPELISPATEPVIGPMGRVIEEGKEAVYGDPVLITPEVPEQWSEPELISPAVEEREPTYKTVTRQMSWTKTSDRDVMQGIDQSKLVPLLTAALQEALGRIEALEAAIAGS